MTGEFSEFDNLFEITEDMFDEVTTPVEDKPQPTTLSIELDSEVLRIDEGTPLFPAGMDLQKARETLDEALASRANIRKEQDEIQHEIEKIRKEFEQRIQSHNDRLIELREQDFEVRRTIRQAEWAVRAAEQALRDAINLERQKDTFRTNALKFDEITMNLPWREFAFEHQIDGAKYLANAGGRAILADKMGLGKTLTSLITCDMLQSQRILVIVPDDVVSNFVREVEHWAPHRTIVQMGKRTKMERDILINVLDTLEEFIVVTNYSAWRKDKSLLDKLIQLRFDTVIMDEAHSVKDVTTSAFKGCDQIVKAENSCPNCGGAIQHVHDSSDRVGYYDDNIGWLPRDYYTCVGDGKPSSKTIDVETLKHRGCGWSQVVDRLAGVEREYGYLRSVKNLIPMTGTVILNKPTDIYALLNLLDDEHYNNKNQFIRDYCETDDDTGKIKFQYGGLKRLTERLAGKYIGRDRKTAGVVLPKQEIVVHDIELDKVLYADQYRIIRQLSEHAMILLESGKALPIPAIIALITRKRQANVWPAGIEIKDLETGIVLFSVGEEVQESIKLDKIIMEPHRTESGDYEGLIPDMTGMGDMTNGERVVVFSQFKGPLAELERRLKVAGISVVRFDGDTPTDLREEIKIDFDRKYCDRPDYEVKWQVVLANYKTGGVGLNFTGATQMIVLDEEWNPGKAEQAYGRIDRMGQTEETTVHILRLENSIDTWMMKLNQEKKEMVEGFESNIDIANTLLNSLRDGDIL